MQFTIVNAEINSSARVGRLNTAHGMIDTPAFMPVGTQASVKAVSPHELMDIGHQIILSNTYHLMVRPGVDIIRDAGGLHRFMSWPHALLTDSGGYQVFSLAKLRKITDQGVVFRSHRDGRAMFLGPVEAMAIQRELGSDIAMVFDECPPYPCSESEAEQAMRRTLHWERLCREQPLAPGQHCFAIVQGSSYQRLREECAEALMGMGFSGYAIGGLSVGEPENLMYQVLDWVTPILPPDKPRYLMGVGTPPQLVEAVARGIDMFDCVLPTRVGRNGCAYTAQGMIQIKAGRYKQDFSPISTDCLCYACRYFTKAYIRHLLNIEEILGLRLLTLHNLFFYESLMRLIRKEIIQGTFSAFRNQFREHYKPPRKTE